MSLTQSLPCAVLLAGSSICLGTAAQEDRFSPDVSPSPIRSGRQQSVPRSQLSPVTEVLPARFRATVYEIQGDTVETLSPGVFAGQSATPESLLKSLSNVATARVLYQVDQNVNAASEQVLVGSGEPVKLAQGDDPDRSFTGVTYVNVGLIIKLSTQQPRPGETGKYPEASFQAQLSTLGGEQAPPRDKSSAFRAAKFAEIAPFEFNQPHMLLSTNSNPATAQTQPVAYVIRYVFDELRQSPVTAESPVQPVLGSTAPNAAATRAEFPASFQATAYEVKIQPDRILRLDGQALEYEAGTADKLLARLAEIGEARITYSLSQVVNVLSDQAIFSTNGMLVTAVRTWSGPTGPSPIFSRVAHNFGFSARFAGVWPTQDSPRPNVTFLIQSSGLAPGGAPLTPEVNADATYVRSITHSELLEFNKPRVMLCVASADESRPTIVSVFRYVFSPPSGK